MRPARFTMRSNIIARNSVLTVTDFAVSTVGSFIAVVLVARAMGPEKLGYYTYVLWLVHVAAIVGHFGVPSATRKYLAEFLGKEDVATAKAILRAMFRLQLASSLVLTGVGVAIALAVLPAEHSGYTVAALLSLIPAMLMSIPTSANMAIEDFSSNVLSSIVGTLFSVLGVLVVLWFEWGLLGLSASLLLSRTVDFACRQYLYQRRFPEYLATRFGNVPEASTGILPELRRRMMSFCLQATGLLVLNLVVWDRAEVFFLRHFSDIRDVAFYSMSFGIMRALANLPQAFGSAAGANLMSQHAIDAKPLPHLAATTLRYQALLALPLAMGMAALSFPFVMFFYGERYEPAIPVLAILALFSIPAALLNGVRLLLIASEHQGFLLKWGIVCAILNLGLDWWWIPTGGAVGAALANGVSQSVAAAGIWAFAVRRFEILVPWRSLLKVAFCAVTMAAAVVAVTYYLSPGLALGAGLLTGIAVFLASLRWTRALEPADRGRLIGFQHSLPPPLRTWYAFGVQVVTS